MNTQPHQIDLDECVRVPPPGVTEFGHEGEYLKRLGNLDLHEARRHVAALEAEAGREGRGAEPGDTIGDVLGIE